MLRLNRCSLKLYFVSSLVIRFTAFGRRYRLKREVQMKTEKTVTEKEKCQTANFAHISLWERNISQFYASNILYCLNELRMHT